jgi:hypothetical protein
MTNKRLWRGPKVLEGNKKANGVNRWLEKERRKKPD